MHFRNIGRCAFSASLHNTNMYILLNAHLLGYRHRGWQNGREKYARRRWSYLLLTIAHTGNRRYFIYFFLWLWCNVFQNNKSLMLTFGFWTEQMDRIVPTLRSAVMEAERRARLLDAIDSEEDTSTRPVCVVKPTSRAEKEVIH